MRLCIGHRTYDLATRALVLGACGAQGDAGRAVADGADIVEVDAGTEPPADGVILCVTAYDRAGVEVAIAAGARMVRLGDGASASAYRVCAEAGVAVVVATGQGPAAEAAGAAADTIVVEGDDPSGAYAVLADVTREACPSAATAAAVVRGARVVRAFDVPGARRVCDVLAAVMEAGDGAVRR